ncbi:CBS domain-containing protein [Desulfobulbus rhabdoformis]|uniref:CBS domain-containing protein n=1 Tax=Desulfobulbus rhabdoformis TaxID=34032 RepID=UPI0019664A2F|nr:CBS domain-containing protein [Desulfobulbus rhabdoformis]MBM9614196.1 CBS domain-containing protein [Desulfobulbus rhabdoformis]
MLKARDIMTQDVITVNPQTSVRELAALLLEKKISGAPVVDEADKVVGVVTESDLIFQNKKVHLPTAVAILDAFVFLESTEKTEKEIKKMAGYKVGDICSQDLVSVTPETELDELATMMAEKKIHTLPVLDGDQLVGIIGKSDIIRTIAQGN